MMGQSIPAPMPPDTSSGRRCACRRPIHSSPGRRSVTGTCCTPCHVALNATEAVGPPLINAPRGQRSRPLEAPAWSPCGYRARASGAVQPLGPEGYDEVPRARGRGDRQPLPNRRCDPPRGTGPTVRATQEGYMVCDVVSSYTQVNHQKIVDSFYPSADKYIIKSSPYSHTSSFIV